MEFRLLLAFALLSTCGSACADGPVNLIPNGNFANSLEGWACIGTCNWIAQGSLTDGTGAIGMPPLGASLVTSSCFSVQPQAVYDVSFDAWANIGIAGADFLMFCRGYADTGCTQSTGNFSYLPLYYFGAGWQSTQGEHAAEANDNSALCEVNFSANGVETRMDNFTFTFNRRLDDIYADGFESSP